MAAEGKPAGDQDQGFGIYVHLPYCIQHCPYCDFNVYVRPKVLDWHPLVEAIACNLRTDLPRYEDYGAPTTLYLGGGTPSLAPPWVFEALLQAIPQGALRELSIEIDPGTFDRAWLDQVMALGFNRFSLGGQSFSDERLKMLGRQHRAEDLRTALTMLGAAGVPSFSTDLIYSLPEQSPQELAHELEQLLSYRTPHVALYALTIHEGTEFGRRLAQGRLRVLTDEDEAELYTLLVDGLETAGYEHYEISNFALDGHRSLHNQGYWMGRPYLGVGPGASSYWRASDWSEGARWIQPDRPAAYIERHAEGGPAQGPDRFEELNSRALFNELLAAGLRTRDGISLETLPHVLVDAWRSESKHVLGRLVEEGFVRDRGQQLSLTKRGRMLVDSIAPMLAFSEGCGNP